MSENNNKKVTKEQVLELMKTRVCPIDGLPIDSFLIARKNRSRYLKVVHHVDGKRKLCHVGRIDDDSVALLVQHSDPIKSIKKILSNFKPDSWVAILNVLEDQVLVMDEETKEKVSKKLNEVIQKTGGKQ